MVTPATSAGATTATTSRFRLRGGALTGRGVVRSPDEEHRAASPLELLFDLTAVVAVARAAAALHHELAADHIGDALVGYAGVFFSVWWAWMNFTWFASAHDGDDIPFRLLTLVQMAGVLVLAAGVTSALEDERYLAVTLGYGIMRCGLVAGWLRVARDEPASRTRALRYAAGISVLWCLWFARLALPEELLFPSLVVLALCELAVPVWAERAFDRPLFHPGHIEERYGLFTIIVLGESILAATTGIQIALDDTGLTADILTIGTAGLVLAFAAWWIYFDHPGHLSPTPDVAFRWGYAHVVIFAALAAMGAGLALASEAAAGLRVTDERVWPKLGGTVALVVIGLALPLTAAVAGCAVVMAFLATTMVLSGRTPTGDEELVDVLPADEGA